MHICWVKYNSCAKEGPLRSKPACTWPVTPHMTRSACLCLRLPEPCANWGHRANETSPTLKEIAVTPHSLLRALCVY